MNKIVKMSLAIVALTALTGVASAATKGGYVGAGLGYSKLQTSDYVITGSAAQYFNQERKLGGLGGRVFGGYNVNQYFGVEGGFSQYAKSRYEANSNSNFTNRYSGSMNGKREYTLSALDLVGKAYLPIGETGANVYALGGVALAHSKVSENANRQVLGKVAGSYAVSKTQNKLRPKFGAGVSYDVPATAFTTNLEWSRIQGQGNLKNDIKATPNADMISLNVAYKFDL